MSNDCCFKAEERSAKAFFTLIDILITDDMNKWKDSVQILEICQEFVSYCQINALIQNSFSKNNNYLTTQIGKKNEEKL